MRKALIILAAVTIPVAVVAQQSVDGSYILHEYVSSTLEGQNGSNVSPGPTQPPTQAGQPPALSLETRDGEPVYSKDGPVFDEQIDAPHGPLTPYGGSNTLDDRTDRVDSLTYFATFDPSVIPYKRVSVQNRATQGPGGDYVMEVARGDLSRVDLGQVPAGSSETFWGTFLLRLESSRLHPIASVAPDQLILQIVTEPDIALEVQRDAADNYFVIAEQAGLVRVNMQVAVDSFYFGGPWPEVSWDEFPTGLVPPMDESLRRHALSVGSSLGFDDSKPPRETLLEMVRYFRDFDARPFPEELKKGDRLDAIATSGIGVCRHRSLAFAFIAQALGIPTRYISNEAHAFVEVYWPDGGWRRVDLGGAADELNASANEGRPVHDPGSDELPEPPRFLEEQQRMARNGWDAPASSQNGSGPSEGHDGGSDSDAGETGNPDGTADEARSVQDGVAAKGEGATNGAAVEELAASADEGSDQEVSEQEVSEPMFQEPLADERRASRLAISEATAVARRGGAIRVDALLVADDGAPLAGRAVDIYLGPVGSASPTGAVRLGTAQTNARGRLSARLVVPKEQAIGRWSLFLHFGGDEEFRPVTAE